jgi:predicted transcriptional regulator
LYGLPDWAGELSQRNRQALAGEVTEGERNARLFAAACDLKGIGVEYTEAERVMLEAARRCGLADHEAVDTLRSAYRLEREPARHNGAGVKTWQRAKAFAASYDWRGQFGRKALSRRAIYLACVERAKLEGQDNWRAAVREIAELANTGKRQANEGLQDLERASLIKRLNRDKGKGRLAGVYRFTGLSKGDTVRNTGSNSVSFLDTPKTTAEQDAFKRLGLVAWHVWKYLLLNTAPTAAAIAKATSLPRSSVYAALRNLTHHNVRLVFRDGAGEYYAEPKTDGSFANMAAHWYDGASPSQTRKALHQLERELRLNAAIKKALASRDGQA